MDATGADRGNRASLRFGSARRRPADSSGPAAFWCVSRTLRAPMGWTFFGHQRRVFPCWGPCLGVSLVVRLGEGVSCVVCVQRTGLLVGPGGILVRFTHPTGSKRADVFWSPRSRFSVSGSPYRGFDGRPARRRRVVCVQRTGLLVGPGGILVRFTHPTGSDRADVFWSPTSRFSMSGALSGGLDGCPARRQSFGHQDPVLPCWGEAIMRG